MGEYFYKEININNLHPDVENFRFDPVKDEKEAIITMINKIPSKIYNLIKSILDNGGIDPSILPNIVPYEKGSSEYVVMEGNRRICALKIIKDLSLIKETDEYSKVSKLLNKYDIAKIPDTYFCTIYENKEDTYFWTYLRHAGELGGEGLVSWDSLSVDRFKLGTKQAAPNISYYIINYLKNNTDYHIGDSRISTTLSRIVDSSAGKQYYNVEIKDNKLVFNNDIDETLAKLYLLINNLQNRSINSRNSNTVIDIQNWIQRLDAEYRSITLKQEEKSNEEQGLPVKRPQDIATEKDIKKNDNSINDEGKVITETDAIPIGANADQSNAKIDIYQTGKRVKTKRLFEDLAYNHVNQSTSSGLIKLGNELVRLSKGGSGANYITYPVATAMLLRAYVEQAFKYFLGDNGHWKILCNNRKNSKGDPTLGEILVYCRNNKKVLFEDKTQLRLFGILFDSDSTIKDYLDLNIHHPNIVTVTNIELNIFSNLGLSSFLNYLIQ